MVILCSIYIITSWSASISVVEYLSAAPMFREITLTNYSHDLNIFCQEISCPGHDNSLHFFFVLELYETHWCVYGFRSITCWVRACTSLRFWVVCCAFC